MASVKRVCLHLQHKIDLRCWCVLAVLAVVIVSHTAGWFTVVFTTVRETPNPEQEKSQWNSSFLASQMSGYLQYVLRTRSQKQNAIVHQNRDNISVSERSSYTFISDDDADRDRNNSTRQQARISKDNGVATQVTQSGDLSDQRRQFSNQSDLHTSPAPEIINFSPQKGSSNHIGLSSQSKPRIIEQTSGNNVPASQISGSPNTDSSVLSHSGPDSPMPKVSATDTQNPDALNINPPTQTSTKSESFFPTPRVHNSPHPNSFLPNPPAPVPPVPEPPFLNSSFSNFPVPDHPLLNSSSPNPPLSDSRYSMSSVTSPAVPHSPTPNSSATNASVPHSSHPNYISSTNPPVPDSPNLNSSFPNSSVSDTSKLMNSSAFKHQVLNPSTTGKERPVGLSGVEKGSTVLHDDSSAKSRPETYDQKQLKTEPLGNLNAVNRNEHKNALLSSPMLNLLLLSRFFQTTSEDTETFTAPSTLRQHPTAASVTVSVSSAAIHQPDVHEQTMTMYRSGVQNQPIKPSADTRNTTINASSSFTGSSVPNNESTAPPADRVVPPSLVLFTTWVRQVGKASVHENVLRRWSRWRPLITPLIFTDDLTLKEEALRHAWDVLPEPTKACGGVPIMREMFRVAMATYNASLFGFVNGDLLMSDGLATTVQALLDRSDVMSHPLLAVFRRINVEFPENSSRFEETDVLKLSQLGTPMTDGSTDGFLTNRLFPWSHVPDLVPGRPGVDMWLVAFGRHVRDVVVVDVSRTVVAVHMTTQAGNLEGWSYANAKCNRNIFEQLRIVPSWPCGFARCCDVISQWAQTEGGEIRAVRLDKVFLQTDCYNCHLDPSRLEELSF
ncbi:uncharacterized protein LOC106011901 [Aplysia californica]|uniref:Uncharacterized protein LOC106011901 n=1 Tax=Aplysia californica TaxID=6500 RepID=A0ABM1A0U8_APLCA|nr:uncharacterized protein LOC106011901 [Aplysia californica]